MGLNFFLIESDLIRAGLPVQELARLYLFSIVTIILICRCFITLFLIKIGVILMESIIMLMVKVTINMVMTWVVVLCNF